MLAANQKWLRRGAGGGNGARNGRAASRGTRPANCSRVSVVSCGARKLHSGWWLSSSRTSSEFSKPVTRFDVTIRRWRRSGEPPSPAPGIRTTRRGWCAHLDGYLDRAQVDDSAGRLRAIVVPHAGLMYSGPVAAYAYNVARRHQHSALVLVGPSHFIPFQRRLDLAGRRVGDAARAGESGRRPGQRDGR